MREARVADLVEVFSLKAVDDLIRRYAPAFFANVRLFDDVLPLVEAAKLTREDWLSSGAGEGVRITGSEACRPYFGV